MQKGNIPVIGSTGIIGFHNVKTTNAPCVTIGRSGNIGKAFFFNHDCWAHNTVLYVNDFKDTYPKYAYYLLKSLDFSQYNVGSAVPTLNRNHIYPITIMLPPPLEQKSIAEVLTSLDDKIDNLTKQNQTLESMIQTLFKSWFINFDPVVAKAECKSKNGSNSQKDLDRISKELGISKDILNLFPNTFEKIPNEFEEIPKGWKKIPCLEYFKFKKGVEPGVKNYLEKEDEIDTADQLIPFIRVGDLQKRSSEIYVKKSMFANYIVKHDHILISLDGTVGIVTRGIEGVVSSGIRTVTDIQDKATPYVYAYLKSHIFLDELERFTPGVTTIAHAGKALNYIETITAPKDIIDHFNNILDPCFQKILNNLKEIDHLRETRDYLLPKLMSGKVTIKGKTK
jgi:type I restriction enzyme S subunit